jgi:multidrug efflux pump subunit AcrA (membrane-fusion protein)
MFADVTIEAKGSGTAALIPHAAVQDVENQTAVYVADPQQPGRFIEREVRLGPRSGNDVAVLSGVKPGDRVVAEGSFAVRAERDRLGLRPTEAPAAANTRPQRANLPLTNHRAERFS